MICHNVENVSNRKGQKGEGQHLRILFEILFEMICSSTNHKYVICHIAENISDIKGQKVKVTT